MDKVFYIMIGGGLGAVARYGLSSLVGKNLSTPFPWPTIAVNSVGCFVIGILWYFFEHADAPLNLKLFLMVGVLGGFTTFSSFALESFTLMRGGEISSALLNILISNVVGLLLVYLGFNLSKIVSGAFS